jgi:hypothetical protein
MNDDMFEDDQLGIYIIFHCQGAGKWGRDGEVRLTAVGKF